MMVVDPNDYIENTEDIIDTEYMRYKKITQKIFSDIDNLNQKIVAMQVSFDDGQRAHASGVQNVYDKFLELEERQKKIEELLRSDRIEKVLAVIPTEEDIEKLFKRVESTSIGKLNEHLAQIREDLEDLTRVFTW